MELLGIKSAKEAIDRKITVPMQSAIILAVVAIIVAGVAVLLAVGAISAH